MAKSKEGKGSERDALLSASASATTGDGADTEATKTMKIDSQPVSAWLKIASCLVMLGFQISSTMFTQLSKSSDGTYPYNSVLLAATVAGGVRCSNERGGAHGPNTERPRRLRPEPATGEVQCSTDKLRNGE